MSKDTCGFGQVGMPSGFIVTADMNVDGVIFLLLLLFIALRNYLLLNLGVSGRCVCVKSTNNYFEMI